MSEEDRAAQGEAGKGFAVAYAFLNRRERTVAEVRARLERAEVRAEEIDAVLAELLEFGYLDDARYARVFTQDKRTLESWGSERIARALRERGVERELIEAALAEEAGQGAYGGGDGCDAGLGVDGGFVQAEGGFAGRDGGPGGREGGPGGREGGPGGRDGTFGGRDGLGQRSAVDGELGRAVALLNQRFPLGPSARRDRERAFGVLARKGYESETAADAVREWARRSAA